MEQELTRMEGEESVPEYPASENPTLLYDAKCGVCKSLAYKIRYTSQERGESVDIVALSDPKAHRWLEEHYPDGWSHDFYLVERGKCFKGMRALPRLTGVLGPKRMAAVVGEYVSIKVSRKRCEAKHARETASEEGDGGTSRGDFLKYAALSPLGLVLAKTPKLEEPFKQAPRGYLVHLAEVEPDGNGGFSVNVRRRNDSVRKSASFDRDSRPQADILSNKEKVLLDTTTTVSANGSGATPSVKIRRNDVRGERSVGGNRERRWMSVHSALLKSSRYDVSINVGKGSAEAGSGVRDAASLSGMIGHDLPMPMADFIVYRNAEGDAVSQYFGAYLAAVKELRRVHAREGRTELSSLYKEVEAGIAALEESFDQSVSESFVPIKNQLVITPMPETLKFVQSPVAQQDASTQASCDCSCSCGACCGCGCGCGICGCSCDCFCCIECSCGCGCCL